MTPQGSVFSQSNIDLVNWTTCTSCVLKESGRELVPVENDDAEIK